MSSRTPLGLFEGVGVELEYAIVDRFRLDIRPICDRLMHAEAGVITGDIEFPDVTWSNELAHHMVEIKTSGPAAELAAVAPAFQNHIGKINRRLAAFDCRLMPAGSHPWMDAWNQVNIWPHDSAEVYDAFRRIFHCRGHGWMNIHALHVNLPFRDDEQFGRLHAAIRLVLPILPALAASSPVQDGRVTGFLDSRLHVYPNNCARIPSMAGQMIPEPIFSIDEYHQRILEPIYRDLDAHDHEGLLKHEWSNARGAIARFVRNAIEIRVIDTQECPAADLAVTAATVAVVRALVEEAWSSYTDQRHWPVEPLARIFNACIRDGEQAVIDDAAYLRTLGFTTAGEDRAGCTAGQLWRRLVEAPLPGVDFCRPQLHAILEHGPLARRILRAVGEAPSHDKLFEVYLTLCECLASGAMFIEQPASVSGHH